MNFKLFSLFLLFLLPIYNCQLYNRIPKNYVDIRVKDFLIENKINNCFEYRESIDILLLKCWRRNELVDVKIDVVNKIFSSPEYSLSVVI